MAAVFASNAVGVSDSVFTFLLVSAAIVLEILWMIMHQIATATLGLSYLEHKIALTFLIRPQ